MDDGLSDLPAGVECNMDRPLPAVTVIIPVYEDAKRLELCLSALACQIYPIERLEIIVVDNGSVRMPAVSAASPARVRTIREEKPGSYAARNSGLRNCGTEVVAFTDSDCIPGETWLEEGVLELLAHPEAGAVIGRMELFVPNGTCDTVAADYDRIFAFKHRLPRPVFHAVTANWFSYRSRILGLGGFNEGLRSGGDSDMSRRLKTAGYPIVFSQDAVVSHPVRTTVREITLKSRRLAGGTYALAKRHRFPALGAAVYFTRRLFWDFLDALGTDVTPRSSRSAVIWVLLLTYRCRMAELFRLAFGTEPRRI